MSSPARNLTKTRKVHTTTTAEDMSITIVPILSQMVTEYEPLRLFGCAVRCHQKRIEGRES